MWQRIKLLVKYFIFWYLFFFTIKSLFLVFNYELSQALSWKELVKVYIYGFRLDVSASSYLLVLPFLFIIPSVFFNTNYYNHFLKWYTYIFIVIISFLTIADLELYQYWGFRLDTTPLLYINTPKEMMASVEWYVIVRQLVIFSALCLGSIFLFNKYIIKECIKITKGVWWELPILLVIMGSLIIPIRGGVGLAPLNTGSAYFSTKDFANHSAINMFWNACFSLSRYEGNSNPYKTLSDEEAAKAMQLLEQKERSEMKLISQERPNVILIMVESYTAKVIEVLGGKKGVTPRFNQLSKEGVLFTNLYSSGVRSDKGIVAILSGFPAQPNNSIIQYPNKTEKLPFLSKDLNKAGYTSAYYYGGDIDFASMRSYIQNGQYSKLVDMSLFPPSSYNAKWGVHDHIVFTRFLNDIDKEKSPFFYTVFTLSSHEPFDVPMKTVIKGDSKDDKFMNSIYYTDSCIGNFIDSAKTKPWWKNTIVVITADHGTLRPGDSPNYEPVRYHIPMLWLGGAIDKDTCISKICSQTDFAFTLLNQLKIKPEKEYLYSKDILNKKSGYAFYSYTRGLGFLTDSSSVAFDFDENMVKLKNGSQVDSTLFLGKAYLQTVYNDYLMK